MSFEPGSPMDSNPISSIGEPKSGKKKWLIGGCGCLGLIAVLCMVGGGIAYLYVAKPMQEMQAIITESIGFAEVSQPIADAVGGSVQVSRQPTQLIPKNFVEDGVPIQELRFAVQGNESNGELVLQISQKEQFKFEKHALFFEKEDGTRIEMEGRSPDELDIDAGD